MPRRDFLAATTTAALGLTLPGAVARAQGPASRPGTGAAKPAGKQAFHMRYAPHFGMFENHAKDMLDQLQFAADEGFTAWEDNGMAGREPAEQERIAAKMEKCGLAMGVFVGTMEWSNASFASGNAEFADKVLADMKNAVEVGKRVRAKWCTVVMGLVEPRLEYGYQMANAIELLRRCADVAAAGELVMVLEALNKRDHPRLFLTTIAQGYELCRAVDSPSCKILDDLYHQQVTEGNLIENLDRAWSEIGYFQIGDNPGRCEPGSGEINYRNVFRHIHDKGYTGILGMEHGNAQGGKEGERALIDAYRQADTW